MSDEKIKNSYKSDEKIKKDNLRENAEEMVKNRFNNKKNQYKDVDELVHELSVHQIELETQNSELKESQIKLEDSRRKYFDLYNFAPVGYFTLDENGIILEVNIAGADLLGIERVNIIDNALVQYIVSSDRNKFHHHITDVKKTGIKQNTDLNMLKIDNDLFYAHLESIIVPDVNGRFKEFRTTITDISELKKSEDALKASEERYREIFHNNHAAMLLIDPVNGDIIDANPAASDFYRYSNEELVKMKISDINISDNSLVLDEMLKASSKQKNHFISKHRLSNGEIRDVDVYSGLVNQKDKKFLYSIIHDISVQKKAEIALRNSEELFRLIFDQSPLGSLITSLEYTPQRINNAFSQMLGYSKKELLSMKFPEFTHPEDLEKEFQLLKLVNSGEIDNYSIEKRYIHKNGEIIWINLFVSAVKDQTNTIVRLLALAEDITERKKAEYEIQRLANVVETSEDAIITKSLDGRILSWNKGAEHVYGYSAQEVLGKNISILSPPEIENELDEFIDKIKLKIKVNNYETIRLTKDNKLINISITCSPVYDTSGKLIAVSNISRDITERKEAEKKLKEYTDKISNINKMLNIEIGDHEKAEMKLDRLIHKLKSSNEELEQFAYVSSHDLREPLRMIISFLKLLKENYSDNLDDDANDFINYAVDGAKRMDMMINDLLEYSRIGSEEREFNYIMSQKILETVLINLKPLIDDTDTIVTHDPLPLIYANEQQMIQLFQNIVGNSIKYRGKETPKIHISSENVDDEYIFSVKDNGIGIKPGDLERIFTMFKRLHTREEYEGTGIGLTISQKILQKHRGRIWVESEPGKGTTFYFSIPNRNY